MYIHQQRSPMLFDMDSPYPSKLRKLSISNSIKDSHQFINFQILHRQSTNKSSQYLSPSKIIQLPKDERQKQNNISQAYSQQQEIDKNKQKERNKQKQYKSSQLKSYNRNKMLKSQQKKRKGVYFRQNSQPQQIQKYGNKQQRYVQRQNTNNPVANSSSNNQNVKKRLTSLERYFQQTKSIQLPYKTQHRINQNQRFISQIKNFQLNLSKAKPNLNSKSRMQITSRLTDNKFIQSPSKLDSSNIVDSNNVADSSNFVDNNDKTERINIKKTRWSQTRPKPLKIHRLENQNVKKQKDNILIQKIMKERIRQYKQDIMKNRINEKYGSFMQRPIKLQNKIYQLNEQVENMQQQIKIIKRINRQKQQRMKQIHNYLGLLY